MRAQSSRTASAAGTTVTGSTNKIGTCLALVLGGAASANMAGDGEVAEPADADRGEHFDMYPAPVALVVPTMPKRLNDGSPSGEASGAADDGRITHQYQRPDLLHVLTQREDAGRQGDHHLPYRAADLGPVGIRDFEISIRQTGRDHAGCVRPEPVDGVECCGFQLVKDRACIVSVEGVAGDRLIDLAVVWEMSHGHGASQPSPLGGILDASSGLAAA